MARASAFASVGAGLIGPDRRARNFTGDRGENAIALELDAALFERLAGDHERGDAGFHVRRAEAEDLAVADGAAQLAHRIEHGAKQPVLLRAGKTRIHMTVDLQRGSPTTAFYDAHGIDAIGVDLLTNRLDAVTRMPVEDELAYLALGARRAGNVTELFGQLGAFVAGDPLEDLFFVFFIDHPLPPADSVYVYGGLTLMPIRRLFVGLGNTENEFFLERTARDLHADRRARSGETARHAHGWKSRYIERDTGETVGSTAFVLAANFLTIDVEPALFAFRDRWNRKADGGNQENVNFAQELVKLFANDPSHSLRHQINGCRDEQRRKIGI